MTVAYLGLGVVPGCNASLSSEKYKVESCVIKSDKVSERGVGRWEIFLPGSEG